ncbi:hypothetical protein M3D63_00760 [Kocuria palustris]|uniref:Panacea domain-containing protein n=1 Tax=Kocuria palustris TaxID=71999 RepID=UPI0021A655ED|nr:hypothetical protein [Kocuria palustris]MCT1833319.1 hypothetical protein [Kocuria palustris]MDH5150911.1 hypothetical protein [Kocuria palustris]
MSTPESRSVLDVATYILERAEAPMTQRKLHQLCYLAHAWHLAITSRPLFHEPIMAGPDGVWIPALDEALED